MRTHVDLWIMCLPKLCNKCNMSEEQLESHDSLSLETSTYFKVPFAITFIYILLKGSRTQSKLLVVTLDNQVMQSGHISSGGFCW